MDQSTINAWHELGDAYIDAYEERTGKDLQENDIMDNCLIKKQTDPFGVECYFGYINGNQYTDSHDNIYDLCDSHPEFANVKTVAASYKGGFISDEDYANVMIDLMSANHRDKHIYAVNFVLEQNNPHSPAVSSGDLLLYQKCTENNEAEYLKTIQAKCKNATLCGDGQLTYLNDEDAITAVRLGLPVGFRTSYEGYHGSDEGMHRFHIANSEAVFWAYKQSDSYENKAAFHFALSDNEIEFLKSLISENEIELTKEAENISTLKVISSRTGWTFRNESGQWHCEEHPDLIVSSDEKTWSWNSHNAGGSDAVSYLQTIEKLEINQAVNELQKHLEEKLCSGRDQNHNFGR